MAAKRRPGYQEWNGPIDISSEEPGNEKAHRVIVWLWIIGIVVFGLLVWGLGALTSLLQPGHGDPFFQWLGGAQK